MREYIESDDRVQRESRVTEFLTFYFLKYTNIYVCIYINKSPVESFFNFYYFQRFGASPFLKNTYNGNLRSFYS